MISLQKKDRTFESKKNNSQVFIPRDITLADDGFHKSKALMYTEWWYFDAEFENGYSTQISVRVNSAFHKILKIFLRLDVYKDGRLLSQNIESVSKKRFQAFKEKPVVLIDNKEVIKGFQDKKTGNYVFEVNVNLKNASVKLKFDGCTKGWKGTVPVSSWAVILPKANVNGTLKINKDVINVNGYGYHDHNWEFTPSAIFNFGWFWGKIVSRKYTITWATIFKNKKKGEPLVVINKDNGNYFNIEPKNIFFTGKEINKENRKYIPHYFQLKAKNKKVEFDISMKVIDIHFIKVMRIFNYWRYHTKCTGYIKIDGETENINQIHMIEFIRFR